MFAPFKKNSISLILPRETQISIFYLSAVHQVAEALFEIMIVISVEASLVKRKIAKIFKAIFSHCIYEISL